MYSLLQYENAQHLLYLLPRVRLSTLFISLTLVDYQRYFKKNYGEFTKDILHFFFEEYKKDKNKNYGD